MIIGKSLTAIVSGDGLTPEIIVTAKAGALLNLHMKNSSIILQSYQLGASETTHTFVVNVSETSYVIDDATNNKRIEVLVDRVEQYSVEIEYVLWLYKDGNECESITGGWKATGTVTKNDTSVRFATKPTNYINTVNSIDITGYTMLKVNIIENSASEWIIAGTGYDSRYIAGSSDYYNCDASMPVNTIGVLMVYLNQSASYNWVSIRGNSTGYAAFDKVWLE